MAAELIRACADTQHLAALPAPEVTLQEADHILSILQMESPEHVM